MSPSQRDLDALARQLADDKRRRRDDARRELEATLNEGESK